MNKCDKIPQVDDLFMIDNVPYLVTNVSVIGNDSIIAWELYNMDATQYLFTLERDAIINPIDTPEAFLNKHTMEYIGRIHLEELDSVKKFRARKESAK